MTAYFSAGLAAATNSPFITACLLLLALFAARRWRIRNPLVHFLIQFLVFSIFTIVMLAANVVPYRTGAATGSEFTRLFVGSLEIIWWLAAASLTVGALRAFLVLGGKPSESKLVQDLLAGLIYLAAAVAIVAYVFDLPVKGLLATSGALAIIIGLVLQSSLGDVFSGIVLNLERPYHVGDWIILDDTVQGTEIEPTWRATHILTASLDVAIVPNSVVAKSKMVNCSSPRKTHGASMRIRLEASMQPAAGCTMLREVLLGTDHVLRAPEPSVTIKELSADMIEFELYYFVADVGAVDAAQNELFNRIYQASIAAGIKFAPRLGALASVVAMDDGDAATPERLVAGISLFSTLKLEEKAALAAKMTRKEYAPGEVIVRAGTVLQSLNIVSYGVLVATEEEDGKKLERLRLTPGIYFGESGLLAGAPMIGEITALTRATVYEISKDALLPLLEARPAMAEELSELLASRQLARRTVLDQLHHTERPAEGLATHLASRIRQIFSLH